MPRGNQHKSYGLTQQLVLRVSKRLKDDLYITAKASTKPEQPVTASDVARWILTAYFAQHTATEPYTEPYRD